MKHILNLLFALLFLLIGLIITGLFLPKSFKTVCIRDVQASPVLVFGQVNNLKNWEQWWPLHQKDTTITISLSEQFAGKGGSMVLNGEETENCTITIMHSVVPESVGTEFNTGKKSRTVVLFYFEPIPGGTRINSTMNITRMSLWERYYALLQKDELNILLEQAIENLCKSSIAEIHEMQ